MNDHAVVTRPRTLRSMRRSFPHAGAQPTVAGTPRLVSAPAVVHVAETSDAAALQGGDWGGREARFHASLLRTPMRGAQLVLVPAAAAFALHQMVMGGLGGELEWLAQSPLRFLVTYLLFSLAAAACFATVMLLGTRGQPTPVRPIMARAGWTLGMQVRGKLHPVLVAA